MKLSELQQHWQADCKLDEMALDAESLKIPNLHSKYLAWWNEERLNLKKYNQEYKHLYKLKWEYYTGKLSDEELERLGWEQFDLKILRQDLDVYLDADRELGELQSKIDYTKQKVDFVENIIKQLVNRGYLIKNAIDFMRFQTGG